MLRRREGIGWQSARVEACRRHGESMDISWSILQPMLYRFGTFELDTAKAELRADGQPHPVEPQVFALLTLLVENRERLVSRDEILDKVWDGRVVSDAALASRIKSARQALGDDGQAQQFIRTIHGQGFRFVAEVKVARVVQLAGPAAGRAARGSAPRIAVAAFDRGAAVSPHRRCRTLRSHRRRPAPRFDHGAVAPALAVRHGTRLVVSPARRGCRHARDRPRARSPVLPVRHGGRRRLEPRRHRRTDRYSQRRCRLGRPLRRLDR